MDRRRFLSALGLGAGAVALGGCSSDNNVAAPSAEGSEGVGRGQRYDWRMVTTWPKNYPGLGTGANRFAERVKQMSGGRINIRVFGAQELVPASEVFDAVRQGGAQLGHGASYYWQGKHPAAPFFTSVPFGMTAGETNSWLHHGDGQALWDELYAPFGLKPFAVGNTGSQMAGWFNKEINGVADLRGLNFRMPGLGGDVMARVGAVPVQMPGSEVFNAMQTGALDAAEWVGPYNDMSFGMHRVAKYYYYPGWQEPCGTMELIINKSLWDELPEDLQAILAIAAQAENQQVHDEFVARNGQALKALVDDHGVQLKRLPEDVLAALKAASDQVIAQRVAGNAMAETIYKSYQQFRDTVLPWQAVGEQAFMSLRDSL